MIEAVGLIVREDKQPVIVSRGGEEEEGRELKREIPTLWLVR